MVSTLKLTKIQIPNSDSDVISLDASTGNITLNKTLGGTSITVQGEGTATTNLQQGLCKVWCNNDQNSTHDIADSFNISSLTDQEAGATVYAYSNAMANSSHAPQSSGFDNSAYYIHTIYSLGTTGHTVQAQSGADLEGLYTTVHGDLA
tara:strand:- start:33 stop:479 length:447 start_codon:yes stop_codon:yes gene_type:complete